MKASWRCWLEIDNFPCKSTNKYAANIPWTNPTHVSTSTSTTRREAQGLDEVFLAKQQYEKETQELEAEMEAVHGRVCITYEKSEVNTRKK